MKKLKKIATKNIESVRFPLLAKILFFLGFAFVLYIAFFQLGKSPLENWDEAWYADVTRTMLQTKEFFVLYWNNALWLDKPPMYMWLSALVSSIIGLSEFSVRTPSAIAGVFVIMLVTWFAYKQYGLVPAFLAFVTITLNNIFVWRMRSGNIDVLVTSFIFAVFLLQVSKYKYKYPLIGFLFGCIFLTKASLVLFPIAIFIVHELFFERKHILKQYMRYIFLIGSAVILPGIWLLIASLKTGPFFYEYFLFRSDQGVAAVNLAKLNFDYVMYTYYSLQRRFFFVFLAGVLFALRYIKDSKTFLILVYGTALILQLSFTERSNNWYLIPAMPFWSLLIALGTFYILKLLKNNIIVMAIVVGITTILAYRTFTINILPILDTAANVNQKQSSLELKKLTKENDAIVRLDHLYPTTVFYTERKIYASPDNVSGVNDLFVARDYVAYQLQNKIFQWVVGKNSDIEKLKTDMPQIRFQEIKVNDEETILKVL